MAKVWLTRGGAHGEFEGLAFSEGTTGGGWSTIPDLDGCLTLDDYRNRVASMHPKKPKAAIRNWATQLSQLREDMQIGDVVVMPRKGKKTAAIGLITSDYRFDPTPGTTHRHFRLVEWVTLDQPKASFRHQVTKGRVVGDR